MLYSIEFCNFWGEAELTGMCHYQLGPVLLSARQESVDNFGFDNIIFSHFQSFSVCHFSIPHRRLSHRESDGCPGFFLLHAPCLHLQLGAVELVRGATILFPANVVDTSGLGRLGSTEFSLIKARTRQYCQTQDPVISDLDDAYRLPHTNRSHQLVLHLTFSLRA